MQIGTLLEKCQENSEIHLLCAIRTVYRLEAVLLPLLYFRWVGVIWSFSFLREAVRLQSGSTHCISSFPMSHSMISPASDPYSPLSQERRLVLPETTPKAEWFPQKRSPPLEQPVQKQKRVICCLSILESLLAPIY